MKKEELIAQLELLPDGAEVFVSNGERIAEPFVTYYSVNSYPKPEKIVAYIETFFGVLAKGYKDAEAPIPEGLLEQLTEPCHDHLLKVCHHWRDIWGTCIACEEEGLGVLDEEED